MRWKIAEKLSTHFCFLFSSLLNRRHGCLLDIQVWAVLRVAAGLQGGKAALGAEPGDVEVVPGGAAGPDVDGATAAQRAEVVVGEEALEVAVAVRVLHVHSTEAEKQF